MTTSVQQPTISIALCTYNGKAYLPVQWHSILHQQLLPNEVVISDDCSSDGTSELLKQITADAPFSVNILPNTARLGYNKNFERALKACTGDLIFICDQDDFWLPEKISTMTQYMIDRPEIQIAFCDAWVTDEYLDGRQNRFWKAVRFDEKAQERWLAGEAMEVLLDGNRVMGCASVIRRSYLTTVLPIPKTIPGYIYDGWMALVAAAQNSIQFINSPLQLYRTHVRQEVGVRPKEAQERIRLRDRFTRHRARKLAPLHKKQIQLKAISALLESRVATDAPGLPQLHRQLTHYTMRSNLPQNRLKRILPVLTNLFKGNYHRYVDPAANRYAPYLAFLGDMLE